MGIASGPLALRTEKRGRWGPWPVGAAHAGSSNETATWDWAARLYTSSGSTAETTRARDAASVMSAECRTTREGSSRRLRIGSSRGIAAELLRRRRPARGCGGGGERPLVGVGRIRAGFWRRRKGAPVCAGDGRRASREAKRRRRAARAVNLIALGEKQLSKVRPILAGDSFGRRPAGACESGRGRERRWQELECSFGPEIQSSLAAPVIRAFRCAWAPTVSDAPALPRAPCALLLRFTLNERAPHGEPGPLQHSATGGAISGPPLLSGACTGAARPPGLVLRLQVPRTRQ